MPDHRHGSGASVRSKTSAGSRGCQASRSARVFRVACAALLALALCSTMSASATSRIKDLANIEGVRQNQLIGYGLVVGLNGTGDTLNNIPFTKQSLQAMLERMGVNIRGATIRTGNVAAVMVTGNLPRLRHPGHADGRHGVGARRRQEPAGRHPARHPPARRRRQRLCGGAGLARDRRIPGRRRRRQRHQAACRPSAASPTAPSSSARSNSR